MNRSITLIIGSTLVITTTAACGGGGSAMSKTAACHATLSLNQQLMAGGTKMVPSWSDGKAAPASGGVQPTIDKLRLVKTSDNDLNGKIVAEVDALDEVQGVLEAPAKTANGVHAQQAIISAALDSVAAVTKACP